MQIKQIMTKDVIFVDTNANVADIAHLLTKYHIHGIPVVENSKVLGIITETDFFIKNFPDIFQPSYLEFLEKAKSSDSVTHKQKQQVEKILNSKAGDLMSKSCQTIFEDGDVKDLLALFKEKNLYTIPVVNSHNNLVGIVTQADMIKLL